MRKFITNFLRDEQGQDLIEYTLLLGVLSLSSAAIYVSAGKSVTVIWNSGDATLNAAAAHAAS